MSGAAHQAWIEDQLFAMRARIRAAVVQLQHWVAGDLGEPSSR